MKYFKSPLQMSLMLFVVSALSFLISGFSIKKAISQDPELLSKLGKKYQIHFDNGIFLGHSPNSFNFHFSKNSDPTRETLSAGKAWQFSQEFKKIKIDSISADVVLRPGIGEQIKILTNVDSEVDVDNVLRVETTSDEILIAEIDRLQEDSIQILIELPQNSLNELSLKTTSGDVSIENVSIGKLSVLSVSGEVILSRSQVKDAHFESTSGDLNFYASQCEKFRAKTVSGNFNFEFERPCLLSLDSISGDAKVLTSGKNTVDIQFNSVSGELNNELKVDEKSPLKIEMTSVSGNLEVK